MLWFIFDHFEGFVVFLYGDALAVNKSVNFF